MKHKLWIAAAGILVLIALVYGPSLQNDFVHDDDGQIVANPYIKELKYWPKAFTSCIWEDYLGTCKGTANYYRPLFTLSYLVTWALVPEAWFFHLVALSYYALLCGALFLLLRRLFSLEAAAVGTLLFLVHPIHTEAVMWIASAPEILHSLFVVVALLLWIERPRYWPWWLTGVYLLGMFAKEPAVLLPGILVAYELLWRRTPWRQLKTAVSWRELWPTGVALALYLGLRIYALGSLKGGPSFFVFTPAEHVMNSLYVLAEYIKKSVWPLHLNPFLAFDPLATPADPRFFPSVVVVGLFAAFFVWALWRRQRTIVFGLLWWLLFLSPVVIFIDAVGENVVSERYLLLPTVGLAFIAADLWKRVEHKKEWRTPLVWAVVGIATVAGLHTRAQNAVWQNSEVFYEHVHQLNSAAGYPADVTYYNLGVIYEKTGRVAEAQKVYEEIIASGRQFPSAYKAYNNLGQLYLQQNRTEEGVQLLHQSIELVPAQSPAYTNLGIVSLKNQEYSQALDWFLQALTTNPNDPEANYNRDVLYNTVSQLPDGRADHDAAFVKFLEELVKTPRWRELTLPEDSMRLKSSAPQGDTALGATVALNPSLTKAIAPTMIFFTSNDEVKLIPDYFKHFDQDKREISLALLLPLEPGQKLKDYVEDHELILYFIFSDFSYAALPLS